MAFITVLLGILKIVLCLIATILALAVVLLAVVLFCDIKYFFSGKISDKVALDAGITWIFKIFKLKMTYNGEDGFKAELKALWLKLWPKPPTAPEKQEETPEKAKPIATKGEPTVKPREAPTAHSKPPKKRRIPIRDKIKAFVERVKATVLEIREKKDKFFYIINYPDREIIIKKALILLKRLKRIARKSRLRISGELGLKDPADTGTAIGTIYSVAGTIGVDCRLKGNFEKEIIDVNVELRGKFTLWSLIWPLAVFILSKPVWKIVRELLFGEEDE